MTVLHAMRTMALSDGIRCWIVYITYAYILIIVANFFLVSRL